MVRDPSNVSGRSPGPRSPPTRGVPVDAEVTEPRGCRCLLCRLLVMPRIMTISPGCLSSQSLRERHPRAAPSRMRRLCLGRIPTRSQICRRPLLLRLLLLLVPVRLLVLRRPLPLLVRLLRRRALRLPSPLLRLLLPSPTSASVETTAI